MPVTKEQTPQTIDHLVSQTGFLGDERMNTYLMNANVLEANMDAVSRYWAIDLRDEQYASPDLDIPTAIPSVEVHREQLDLLEGVIGLRTMCEEDAKWLGSLITPLLGETVYFVGDYARDYKNLGDRQLRSRTNPQQPVYGEGVLEDAAVERLKITGFSHAELILELSGIEYHGGDQIEFVMNTDRVYVPAQSQHAGTHVFGNSEEAERHATWSHENSTDPSVE